MIPSRTRERSDEGISEQFPVQRWVAIRSMGMPIHFQPFHWDPLDRIRKPSSSGWQRIDRSRGGRGLFWSVKILMRRMETTDTDVIGYHLGDVKSWILGVHGYEGRSR